MKLSRISRIVRILTLLQSGHSYSADDFAAILEVSRRTFFRDLKELAAIGVPYSFDPSTGGYSLDPEYFLPSVDLTLQEALSLLLLIHKGTTHLPIPFKNSALLGGLKIENNLPPNIRRYCSASLEAVTVAPDAHAHMDGLGGTFAQLQQSVQRKRKVEIVYHSLFDQADITLTLSPYHLMYNRRAWYVIGRSSTHNEIRTFKLNRIKNLRVLDTCFAEEDRFDITDYFGKAWSMIPEGRMFPIKLRFSPKVASNVAEVRWHSTQQNTWNDDGSLDVDFRIDGIGEITWWILGYGDHAEVLEPKLLRDRIADIAKRMVERNK